MAAPMQQSLSPVSQMSGSSCGSRSSKKMSFGSWTRKPRDSLEKMRKKSSPTSPSLQHSHRLLSLRRTALIQIEEDDIEEANFVTAGVPLQPSPSHPPVTRSVYCQRCPKGKAVMLVLVLNVLVSYAFGAAITGILTMLDLNLHQNNKVFFFVNLFIQYCASRMFYPISGFLADAYIGRYRMIRLSAALLWVGYALMTISFVLEEQVEQTQTTEKSVIVIIIIRATAFLLISAGGGGFEATIIPFGVDQLQGASSSEISSYFYFFYFGRNLAMVCGILVYCFVSYITPSYKQHAPYNSLQPLVSMVVLTVGIVLNLCLNHWYFKDRQRENPVKLVLKVLCYAAVVKRKMPQRRKAFRYGEERKPRIELAKVQYDGKFSSENVEDVKIFCRICLLLIALSPALVSVTAFFPNAYMLANAAGILLCLPLMNWCVIPCFPQLSIRARLGLGLAFYAVANTGTVIIHSVSSVVSGTHPALHLGLLVLPTIMNSVAEILTIVSMLEFIYAQSPESMKGLLTGLLYFVLGLSSIAATVVFYKYPKTHYHKYQLLPYHVTFTIIQLLGLIFYAVVAVLHTNRQRPDNESYDRMIAEVQATSLPTS